MSEHTIHIPCDTLQIINLDNDIHGNTIITLALTADGVTAKMAVSFDEAEKMQFEFQAPVVQRTGHAVSTRDDIGSTPVGGTQ